MATVRGQGGGGWGTEAAGQAAGGDEERWKKRGALLIGRAKVNTHRSWRQAGRQEGMKRKREEGMVGGIDMEGGCQVQHKVRQHMCGPP